MPKYLVIVESPAKAKTIEKFLGKDFQVKASMGHVRDLPKHRLSIDIEKNFEPKYVVLKNKAKIINDLKKSLTNVKNVYLAPDPDREGEAIAWHLVKALKIEKIAKRIEFNEITEKAVQEALKNPREIDINRVEAQQTRRILDRIVGYKISPLLWKKIQKGLSAGRVQSVAVKLICEREAEINAFQKEEYWTIKATLKTEKNKKFDAELKGLINKPSSSFKINNKQEAQKIENEVKNTDFIISKITKKERKRQPSPPFITSTLQQEASRKLGYSARKTMMIAQQLYEGIECNGEHIGLITYMRTDSVRISDIALAEARRTIQKQYGIKNLPPTIRKFKIKKTAQDAHEAIRPTATERLPEKIKSFLSKEQAALYELIWKRFVASQMANALIDTTSIDIEANKYLFRATGSIIKFPGFMQLYIESSEQKDNPSSKEEEKVLPSNLSEKQKLILNKLLSEQHFTQPPPRYTEASLVKTLEEKGIGRPSTYAPIIGTIQDRGYVSREKKVLFPTEMGLKVNKQLVTHFPNILEINFTAKMENNLDEIMTGKIKWQKILKDFYYPFDGTLQKAYENMENLKPADKPTEEICDKCGSPMVIKQGRYGEFIACTGFPKCRNTKHIAKKPKLLSVKCPDCGAEIAEKRTKRGKIFYGCSKYPDCKFATWDKPLDQNCPKCNSFLVESRKKQKCVKCDYIKETK